MKVFLIGILVVLFMGGVCMASEKDKKLSIEERLDRIEQAMGEIVSTTRTLSGDHITSLYSSYISSDVLELQNKIRALEQYLNIEYQPEKTNEIVTPTKYIKREKF